ncbi:proteoglycan 4-like [Cynara cardunculus var. scolymus]|uniref:proteoglycan 4-like n=1 Tax=Cynara cardunculus var. scolymus TaxID=59895 RepID=UPI000D624D3D|nr:proteoglycan 4-like [Cynara cardunculus var. scolymus]
MARVKRALVRDPPPLRAAEPSPTQPSDPPPSVANAAVRTPVSSRRQPTRKGKRLPIAKKKKGESSTILVDEDLPSPLSSPSVPPSPSLPPSSTPVAVDTIPPEVPIAAPPLQIMPSAAIVPFTDPLKKAKEMVKSSTLPLSKESPTSSPTTKNREMPETSQKVHSSSDSTPPNGLFTSDSEEDEDLASKAQTREIFMENEDYNLENIMYLKSLGKLSS